MAERAHSTAHDPHQSRPVWSQYETEPLLYEQAGAGGSLGSHLIEFARENPAAAALWCFCIGFVVGWRVKPW
jgi:hypothetical protein